MIKTRNMTFRYVLKSKLKIHTSWVKFSQIEGTKLGNGKTRFYEVKNGFLR